MRDRTRALDRTPEQRAIDELFAELERRGFVTRQGDICCGSCAAYELASANEAGTPVAHYNEQSVERGYGEMWIGHGVVGASHEDAASVLAGALIVDAAHDLGIPVEWDGDPARCVQVGLGVAGEDEDDG